MQHNEEVVPGISQISLSALWSRLSG